MELATAALFLLVFLAFGLTLKSTSMAMLCFLLLGLAVMDAETLLLPDAFTLPGIGLGILYSALNTGWRAAIFSAGWALLAVVLILLIRGAYWLLRRQEGIGLGDAKLLALIAAWLGPLLTLLVFVLGVLAAAIFALAWIAFKKRDRLRSWQLPFGSFLCAAAIFTIFHGQQILRWYLQFFP